MPTSHVKYHYVDNEAALVGMVAACRAHAVVTVDTEFARSHTYYPEVGLVQVYDGENCYLIDPLAVGTLEPLAPLLEDTSVLKVFHACSEDMEVFQYATSALPSPVFDTQIAAAAVGVGFSMSYQNLVSHYLGIDVTKEQTRSDWLQRPLTQAQLDYAALDVIYLLMVFNKQHAELAALSRRHWVDEECSMLASDIAITLDPDKCYLRVKSAARMSPAELNVLRLLCAWRERKARARNVPRNRVIEEKALVALARSGAGDTDELQAAGLSPRQIRKYGDDMLELLKIAQVVPETEYPEPIDDGTAINIRNDQIKRLKQVVDRQAEILGIAPEMLARRRHLEQLLRTGVTGGEYELPGPLSGWRKSAIGRHLLAALEGTDQ